MQGLNNILNKPQYVEGLGNVHPIKLSDYELFMQCAQFLQLTLKHFDEELHEDYTLFELVTTEAIKSETLPQFLYMIEMTTKNKFELNFDNEGSYIAESKDSKYISNENFEQFRDVVMKQNLLYEDKVFKNPMVKKWADKVIKAREKNSVDMTLEDIISVVHVFTGISYEDISKYTMYQLRHTFQRVCMIEDYRKVIQFMCAGASDAKPTPFMEKIELYKNPYDDVFVDKSKLKNLNQSFE